MVRRMHEIGFFSLITVLVMANLEAQNQFSPTTKKPKKSKCYVWNSNV